MKDRFNIIINIIILSFILILHISIMNYYPNMVLAINAIFWLLLLFIIYKLKGLRKNKTLLYKNSISIIIIWILGYIILSFIFGLYIGFLTNTYSTNIVSIIKNIYSFIIMIISQEYIREVTIRKKNNKYNLIILTIIYSILDVLLITNFSNISSNLKIYIFIFSTIIPILVRNILSSYLVYNFGIKSSIIYRLFFTIYPYIFPIYPNINLYLNNVLSLLIPYLIYFNLSNMVNKYNNNLCYKIKKTTYIKTIIFISLLAIVVCLVSGIGKYKIISIASGSMEPYINIGDAIIYEKIDKYELKIDDIVVLKKDNRLIAHRIIYMDDDKVITKGDNNFIDDGTIDKKDIIGIVKLKIKFIGFPSIWVNDLLE